MSPATVIRDATIDGSYRYDLSRRWGGSGRPLLWVMLNPSTADAEVDDPTIRRVVAFTKAAGINAATVVNLFAYRSPKPKDLLPIPADVAVGPLNDEAIERHAEASERIVVAWGNPPKPLRYRAWQVLPRLERAAAITGHPVACLGMTKSGHPLHPLFVPAETTLRAWRP